ncbi:MAG: hypothetical protein M1840_000132 [Geoglossum simile]|nr:MAG: hypothetical protein M1840_000132 [Geoglossum simile]
MTTAAAAIRAVALMLSMLLLLWVGTSHANIEKVVFLGPKAFPIPPEHPNLDDLQLASLSPRRPYLRTQLRAAFPGGGTNKGEVSWFLLEHLRAGQRYELRICWAATQPTQFWLYTYPLPTVFETPTLITSLASYSGSLQNPPLVAGAAEPALHGAPESILVPHVADPSSILFLQLFAAADYFTSNASLMQNVPLLDVDIILDPYLLNAIPRSLVPTATYIAFLAAGSWLFSGIAWSFLSAFSQTQVVKGSDTTESLKKTS